MDNFSQLQLQMRRDPEAHAADFDHKFKELMAALDVIAMTPQIYNSDGLSLLNLVSHTVAYYVPPEAKNVDECYCKVAGNDVKSSKIDHERLRQHPVLGHRGRELCMQLLHIIKDTRRSMHAKMRRLLISTTFLLRSKRMIDIFTILPQWIELLDLEDRDARWKLFTFIIRDLTIVSKKIKHTKTLGAIQDMIFMSMQRATLPVQLLSCCIAVEMHKRRMWEDAVVVNTLARCALSGNLKMALAGTHFLLGTKNYFDTVFAALEEAQENADESAGNSKMIKVRPVHADGHFDFRAIDNLFDPQSFADELFERCKSKDISFSARILMLHLTSVLIARHGLLVPNFYTFLIKYAFPKQKLVTKILAIAAQAVHPQVPSEFLQPLVKQLVDQFISDDREDEVIAVGINTVREMAAKFSQVLDGDSLAQVLQVRSKAKPVTMALKSLINLYRQVAPELLHPSMRGKEAGTKVVQNKRRKTEKTMSCTRILSQYDHLQNLYQSDQSPDDPEEPDESESKGDADAIESESDLDDQELEDLESDDDEDPVDEIHENIDPESSDSEQEDILVNPELLKMGSKRKLSAAEKRQESVRRRMEKKRQRLDAKSSKGKRQSTTNK
ncbi:bifunctional SDA1 domain/Sda1 [Babesia duncani]|uniref:Protein SDA1 n=1 Tax=Babesia duncani TaxID=323732 RepID=A0AAD9UPW0_9APIC|nr:bifunctional SDA1 domain/Sda1 [Babesia duncani]